jgi:uncharacterized membrane protein
MNKGYIFIPSRSIAAVINVALVSTAFILGTALGDTRNGGWPLEVFFGLVTLLFAAAFWAGDAWLNGRDS